MADSEVDGLFMIHATKISVSVNQNIVSRNLNRCYIVEHDCDDRRFDDY